ncbi:MAG: hypothetical protein WCI36_04475 [bacterium]
MQQKVVKNLSIFNLIAIIVAVAAPFFATQNAQAGGLGQLSIRLDRMAAGATTGGTVCARPVTVDTETLVMVTFPTGFTVNPTATNWTVTTTNIPSGTTAWPGIGTATLVAGQSVTFPSTDLTIATTYCFNFSGTTTLTNATAGIDKVGSVTTQKAGPTTIDSSQFALATITDDTIIVSATVPPNFSFALSGNTDTLGTLSASSVSSSAGKTATIITNASNGWVAWVKSASASGLTSASTGANIPFIGTAADNTVALISAGTSSYGLDVTWTDAGGLSTGVVSQAANFGQEFDGDATHVGTPSTTFQPIAAASGITAGDTVTLTERVAISALQASASDYTDTLTVIAAGRF